VFGRMVIRLSLGKAKASNDGAPLFDAVSKYVKVKNNFSML